MTRALVLLLALALPLAAQTPPHVKVQRADTQPNVMACGSGTCVQNADGASYILTCKHVVPDGTRRVTVLVDGGRYAATFVRADTRADLALLRIDGTLKAAAVADTAPAAGSELWQSGCPGGGPAKLKTGKLRETFGVSPWWVGFKPEGGDSGAGVFHNGRLVGVTYAASVPDWDYPGVVVPLADVRRFLRGE